MNFQSFVQQQTHTSGAPLVAAGVSCALGFDFPAFLGYVGPIVGLISGVLSIAWVGYQFVKAVKNGNQPVRKTRRKKS